MEPQVMSLIHFGIELIKQKPHNQLAFLLKVVVRLCCGTAGIVYILLGLQLGFFLLATQIFACEPVQKSTQFPPCNQENS